MGSYGSISDHQSLHFQFSEEENNYRKHVPEMALTVILLGNSMLLFDPPPRGLQQLVTCRPQSALELLSLTRLLATFASGTGGSLLRSSSHKILELLRLQKRITYYVNCCLATFLKRCFFKTYEIVKFSVIGFKQLYCFKRCNISSLQNKKMNGHYMGFR